MAPHIRRILLVVVAWMFSVSTDARLDIDSAKKLKDNWIKFVESLLTPNVSCYKTVADYGTLEVTKLEDEACDVKIVRKGASACLKVTGAKCMALVKSNKDPAIRIELTVCNEMFRYNT